MSNLPMVVNPTALAKTALRVTPIGVATQVGYEMVNRAVDALDSGELSRLYDVRGNTYPITSAAGKLGEVLGDFAGQIDAMTAKYGNRLGGGVKSLEELPSPTAPAHDSTREGWQPPTYQMRHGGLNRPQLRGRRKNR